MELKKTLVICFIISLLVITMTQINIFEYGQRNKESSMKRSSSVSSEEIVKEFDDKDLNVKEIFEEEMNMRTHHIYYISRGLDKETDEPLKSRRISHRLAKDRSFKTRKENEENEENDRKSRAVISLEYTLEAKILGNITKINNDVEPPFAVLNPKVSPLSIVDNATLLKSHEWKKDPKLNPLLLPQPILFIHVPKTAGTTFKKIILKNVDVQRYFHKDVNPNLQDVPIVLESTFVFGHMRFGLHRYFEEWYAQSSENMNKKLVREREDQMNPYSYLTFLRHPVERVFSHYYFLKENIDHPLHSQTLRLSFPKWVQRSTIAHNEMCRRLVGISREDSYPPDFGEECLFRLKYTFKFIGLTEKFDESLVLLSHYIGFTDISYISANVGQLKKDIELADEDREMVEAYNQFDMAIYKEAIKMFEMQIDQVGREFFNEELNKFKLKQINNN